MAMSRSGLAVTLIVLAALLGLSLQWFVRQRSGLGLPPAERAALYQRTMANLTTVCHPPTDALKDFCESQADLALSLPECDDECHRVCALVRPHATK